MCIYMVSTYNCIYVICVLSFYVSNSFVRIDITRPLLSEFSGFAMAAHMSAPRQWTVGW